MSVSLKCKNYLKNISYYRLFIAIELVLTAVFLTLCVLWKGEPIYKVLPDFSHMYKDYFIHIGFASAPIGTNIYEFSHMTCFPPLAYLMYGFLARVVGYHAENYDPGTDHQSAGLNLTVFLVYNLICIVLLIYAVSLYAKKKGFVNMIVFPSLLILSYPIVFSSVYWGNSAFLVAILISIALAWRDDPSKVKREAALVLIAICAGLKIYPAVFGLLYLKEKRWAETLRLVIYGLILFFVPFAFFGGIAGFKSFFATLVSLYGTVNPCSINGVTANIVRGAFGAKTELFAGIVQQLCLVFSLIAFFCVKNKRSEVLILCCLMTIYVSSNWMYTCVYLLPALLVFFAEHDGKPIQFRKGNIPDYLAFLMFLVVFSRPFALGGYQFIYIAICIIISLYNIVVIGAAIYRKWVIPILVDDSQ